jgi:hypothetical protein
MDDGDPSMFRKGPAATTPSEYASLAGGGDPMIPANELIRLRTRTGHQLLLHNSEDLIYIAHGSGQTWIEMTAAGTLEVYSKGNISFHSDEDINFDAGKNINFKAGADINMIAASNIAQQTGANWDITVGANGRLTCGGTSHIASSGHFTSAKPVHLNGPPAETAAAAGEPSVVVAGAGSATSETAGGATGSAVTQEDTFAACVAELREEVRNAETADSQGTNVNATLTTPNSGAQ